MKHELIIVSGYSGSGKSQVLKTLEDVGYYSVDNIPIKLLEPFLELYEEEATGKRIKIAACIDIRSNYDFDDCREIIDKLKKKKHFKVKLVFFTADTKTLSQRFQETRRIHPVHLSEESIQDYGDLSFLKQAIDVEIAILEPLRLLADIVVDTSVWTVHKLKKEILSMLTSEVNKKSIFCRIISFGFSKGVPPEVDMVFDVRFIPNPYFQDKLKHLTGKDKPVVDYIISHKVTKDFWNHLSGFIDFLVPKFISEGKNYLTIGIGCTGGKHRSVMIAEKLNKFIKSNGFVSQVEHRDIYR